jgi:uncharacterized membrane-anchored protein
MTQLVEEFVTSDPRQSASPLGKPAAPLGKPAAPLGKPAAPLGKPAAPLGIKVPTVGALFWIVKLLTTGIGEATGDFLAKVNLFLAAGVGIIGFVVAMRRQLRARTYSAPTYWTAVLAVAVFGTMAADGIHIVLGVPYALSTLTLAIVLAIVFRRWWRSEGTLSIHSIDTPRRERFYWTTVLATFALGTALGDLTASTLHLGFFGSAVLFAVAITVPAIGWARFGLNPVAAFWAAYVITRPLGASIADWLGKPHSFGHGLGYGDGTVTAIGLSLFVAAVAYLAWTKHDAPIYPADAAEAVA